MSGIVRPSQSQQKVVAQDQATLDRTLQISIIRRTSLAGLIGLVYGICASVILAAYHDFGSLSLLEPSRLMEADPLPKGGMLEDAVAAPELMPQLATGAARADAGPVALPISHIRPAMAPWSAAEPVGGVDAPPPAAGRDIARDTASPDASGNGPVAAAPEPAHRRHPDPGRRSGGVGLATRSSSVAGSIQSKPAAKAIVEARGRGVGDPSRTRAATRRAHDGAAGREPTGSLQVVVDQPQDSLGFGACPIGVSWQQQRQRRRREGRHRCWQENRQRRQYQPKWQCWR
jgi:hypothetical protein